MRDGVIGLLARHRGHALGHAYPDVIAQVEPAPAPTGEALQQVLDGAPVAVSDVDPLGHAPDELCRVFRRGIERIEEGGVSFEAADTRPDAAIDDVFPQSGQELVRYVSPFSQGSRTRPASGSPG